MDRADIVHLPEGVQPESNWRVVNRHILPLGGVVVALKDPVPATRRGLAMPEAHPRRERVGGRTFALTNKKGKVVQSLRVGGDVMVVGDVAGRYRDDTGTVAAVGPNVPELEPGDWIVIAPYKGNHYKGERFGGVSAGETVYLGVCSSRNDTNSGVVQTDPYDAVVMAVLERATERDPLTIKPTGRNILIRRDPVADNMNGVHLPDSRWSRGSWATVVAVGRGTLVGYPSYADVEVLDAEGNVVRTERRGVGEPIFEPCRVKPGDRVKYHSPGLYEFDFGGAGFDPALAMLWEDNILAVEVPSEHPEQP